MPLSIEKMLIAIALVFGMSAPIYADEVRTAMPLTDGWRFHFGDVPSAEKDGFQDSDWQAVRVPHTWNRVGYYFEPHSDAAKNRQAVNKEQGVAWYRVAFDADARLHGKQAWLEFDAASRIASVWLNGIYVGEHRGGFSRFRLNVTAALRPGAKNVLAVRVDNSVPAPGTTTKDVLPLTGDFFVYGGLYRPVRLVSTATTHIAMGDFGGPGVYASTTEITGGAATVQVRARVRNDNSKAVSARLTMKLIDREGHVAAVATRSFAFARSKDQELTQVLRVASPHLWQGTGGPYLYRLVVELSDRRNTPLDRVEQPFGLRTIGYDANRGFLLNGKPYQLHGVGYHQDTAGKGWALSREDVESDVATMREMGVNSIRLTHYQHSDYIHDVADRLGLIVWDEIPLVSRWTQGQAMEPSAELVANARQQLLELIRQNYNHASVAVWGIANEVDFGNSMPAFLTGGSNGHVPDPLALLGQLQALAKSEDQSRPTGIATCCEGRLFQSDVSVPDVAQVADIGGANRYFGWYYGDTGDLGPNLDALHAKRPTQPLAVTEYGAGGATSMHTDNVLGGPSDSRGRNQPEEFESYVHETAWRALSQRPYLFATWLWNSFDFPTTVRAEGDAQDLNTKGLVTYDRKIRKDVWYFYKANWTNTPTVHVNGSRYVDRAYPYADIRVYSNAPSTELILNGRSLGTQSACEQAVCVWKDVPLAGGTNAIQAVGHFGGSNVEDRVEWKLDPVRLSHIAIDCGALMAAKGRETAFGSDNFFTGGQAMTLDKPADYGRAPVPTAIEGAIERDALATYRSGSFSYRIPMQTGRYEMTLWFVTPPPGKSANFDVAVNGQKVLSKFDLSAHATEQARAVKKVFEIRSDGHIAIDFKAVNGEAMVSAIELMQRH